MNNKHTTERYIVSAVARENGELHSKSYALGFTGFDTNDMIPILCDYDDNDVWTFEDIKTAKNFGIDIKTNYLKDTVNVFRNTIYTFQS